ncbi:hypothetical protein HQ393_12860 [Chitinibacter bivalviorum]|uniref:Fels-1 Prophage Protein-like n=1 Tax=Chitinibacter bivalviorum TaxID=2739434 RepID=A0A7H9BK51_9NEIS|nr:YcgJ family protein [Chitinibacter bivalviorum]QLG89057.1 hypothetical protein HQ393_12860 [Chitinibacter bivalviorum]
MSKTLLITMLLTSTSLFASGLDYKPGAICDKKAGFCADMQGVSVALTKEYLGAKAEQKLMDRINKVGAADFDPTWFTMSGGLTCKTKEKTCWSSRYGDKVDAKATKTLFGS